MESSLGMKNRLSSVEDFKNIDMLDLALQVRACYLIATTMEEYNASQASKKEKDNDLFYQAKNTMTDAHLKCINYAIYRQRVYNAHFKD